MKTSMKRFLANSLPVFALACASGTGLMGGSVRTHPAALVGEWVDVARTSTRDSSVWLLASNGDDGLLRITIDSTGAASRRTTHYGYWYAIADGNSYRLCITRRPGREAGLCSRIELHAPASDSADRRAFTLYREGESEPRHLVARH